RGGRLAARAHDPRGPGCPGEAATGGRGSLRTAGPRDALVRRARGDRPPAPGGDRFRRIARPRCPDESVKIRGALRGEDLHRGAGGLDDARSSESEAAVRTARASFKVRLSDSWARWWSRQLPRGQRPALGQG